jgi:hypothetical protein
MSAPTQTKSEVRGGIGSPAERRRDVRFRILQSEESAPSYLQILPVVSVSQHDLRLEGLPDAPPRFKVDDTEDGLPKPPPGESRGGGGGAPPPTDMARDSPANRRVEECRICCEGTSVATDADAGIREKVKSDEPAAPPAAKVDAMPTALLLPPSPSPSLPPCACFGIHAMKQVNGHFYTLESPSLALLRTRI